MRSAARTVIAGPSISARTAPGATSVPSATRTVDARGRREEREEAGEERGAGDDGALAADDPGREPGGRAEDGQRGHVLAVLGESAGQEVVEVFREVPGELRHARTEYLRRPGRRAEPMQMTGMSGPVLRGIIERFARPSGAPRRFQRRNPVNLRSGRLVFASVLVLLAAGALADEGMWMPQQIPQLAPRLKEMGFQGDPQAFADLTGQPMGAIVSLGGCSASFVSPDGLIVTNNHCVQGALQYNSKPERNLMVDGYLAKTRADELWNGPGSRVFVTVSVKDVTDEIAGKIDPKLDGPQALRRHRAARQGEDGRVREGRPALLGRAVLRGAQVVRARPDGDPGRAARLRAAGRHRQLRRRDGQLAVAPPHGRLVLLPRLRLEGRQGRAVLEGQRPLQAEALAQGLARGREPGRPRLRRRATRGARPA